MGLYWPGKTVMPGFRQAAVAAAEKMRQSLLER